MVNIRRKLDNQLREKLYFNFHRELNSGLIIEISSKIDHQLKYGLNNELRLKLDLRLDNQLQNKLDND